MSQKTLSKTRLPSTIPATKKAATVEGMGEGINPSAPSIQKPGTSPVSSWEFKITGRGTSGWMSWVKEGKTWVQLRASETSFVSAVAAIEPEIMRLAFPHKTTGRKAI